MKFDGGSVTVPDRVVLNDMEKDVEKSYRGCKEQQRSEGHTVSILETARSNGIEHREFFRLLYMLLIGSDHGTRLGTYIVDIRRLYLY